MRTLLCRLALFFVLVPRLAAAQTLDQLRAGDRLRIRGLELTTRGERRYQKIGNLAALDSIRIVIVPEHGNTFDSLPMFAMTDLQISRGIGSRKRSMAIGASAGAIAGSILWLLTRTEPQTLSPDDYRAFRQFGRIAIPALTGLGLTVGALTSGES